MSETRSLFDDTHEENITRVRSRIGAAVLTFLRERLATGRAEFTAGELRAYVVEKHGTAPGSPDRILRDLRQRGQCEYELVSRRGSLYRVSRVS